LKNLEKNVIKFLEKCVFQRVEPQLWQIRPVLTGYGLGWVDMGTSNWSRFVYFYEKKGKQQGKSFWVK
jgi:hypothetical protein